MAKQSLHTQKPDAVYDKKGVADNCLQIIQVRS